MKRLSNFHILKNRVMHGKYVLLAAVLVVQSLLLPILQVSTASAAAPTYSSYPITSTYKKPGAMTTAGGSLWYLESTNGNGPIDSIGRMTTAGVTTDYTIGHPSNATGLTVNSQLIAGPDGNVWFNGSTPGGVYLGKLDVSTGTITFYASSISSYSPGSMGAGPDGKLYYTAKSANSGISYLVALNLSTGTSSTVQTYDTYSNLAGITTGSDGRLYVTDAYQYYNRIYAVSVTGGTNNTFSLPDATGSVISGPDGNLWFTMSGKIVKMTTSGSRTEYTQPTGISAYKLVAGPDGAVWFLNGPYQSPKIGRITTTGVFTSYTIPGSSDGPVVGPDNAIWFDYYAANGVQNLGRFPTEPNAFTSYPITSTYKKPGAMTVAAGDLWYLESTNGNGPIDSIGRMTTAGVTTDYSIGYPSGLTSITVDSQLITGPDGNVWFIGGTLGGVYLGKLDVSTGLVSFYGTAMSGYSPGSITTGPDGKLYYTAKYAGGPANSYLLSFNPATGTSSIVRTYDTYSNLAGITTGPDGRLYVADTYQYYNRIYAVSITGGTDNTFSFSEAPTNITSGLDGNIWFSQSGKVVKMTPAGVTTAYNLPTGVSVYDLIAGADGNIWFLNGASTQKIGRITATGVVTTYAVPGTAASATGPIVGPDGAIWFDYYAANGVQNLGRLGY